MNTTIAQYTRLNILYHGVVALDKYQRRYLFKKHKAVTQYIDHLWEQCDLDGYPSFDDVDSASFTHVFGDSFINSFKCLLESFNDRFLDFDYRYEILVDLINAERGVITDKVNAEPDFRITPFIELKASVVNTVSEHYETHLAERTLFHAKEVDAKLKEATLKHDHDLLYDLCHRVEVYKTELVTWGTVDAFVSTLTNNIVAMLKESGYTVAQRGHYRKDGYIITINLEPES